MNSNIKTNINKIYILSIISRMFFIMPIIVLFFEENGLNMSQILLLQSIYALTIVLSEIPSGYFGDIIGRKQTLIYAFILTFIGYTIYSFSYNFTGFLIAEIILGIGVSLLSGTDSALVYDTLIQLNKTKEYKKIESKMLSLGNIAYTIASFIGGYLALMGLRTTFYAQIIIMFIAIPISFTLIEPKREIPQDKETIFDTFKVVKYAFITDKKIKWLLIYSGFLIASHFIIIWFAQPYFKLVNLPLIYFGIVLGILNLILSFFTFYAYKIEAFFKRTNFLISLILISIAGFFLLALYPVIWGIYFLILFYFVFGVGTPMLRVYLNKLISSDIRATVLSLQNLIGRLCFAILGPLIGWFSDAYTLITALIIAGSIFTIWGIVCIFNLYRHKAL